MLDAGSLQSEPLALPRPIREKVVNNVLPPLPLQLPPPMSHLRAEAAPYPGICASMLIPVRKAHESRKQSQTDFELHAPCGDYGSPTSGEQQQHGPPPLASRALPADDPYCWQNPLHHPTSHAGTELDASSGSLSPAGSIRYQPTPPTTTACMLAAMDHSGASQW
jgi:hypothetical protein